MLKCFPGCKEAQSPAGGTPIALAVPGISVLQELCPCWLGGAHGGDLFPSRMGWSWPGALCKLSPWLVKAPQQAHGSGVAQAPKE